MSSSNSGNNSLRVVDGILLAHDVLSAHQQRTGNSLTLPIPLLRGDGLVKTIADRSKIGEISAKCLKWPGDMCRGWLERYRHDGSEKAKIFYSASLNTCWARLVICKEAAHLLIGDTKNFTSDPVALVNGILKSMPLTIDAEIDAEWIALVVAMNLLIPWSLSQQILAMQQNGSTNYDIAYELRVPELLIDQWLSSQMQKFLAHAHEAISS